MKKKTLQGPGELTTSVKVSYSKGFGFEHFFLGRGGGNLLFLMWNCAGVLRNQRMNVVSLAGEVAKDICFWHDKAR